MAPSLIVPQVVLHKDGPSISRIVYGTWHLTGVGNDASLATAENVLKRIHACLECGITTFDLSDLYGFYEFEKLFGDALRLEPGIRQRIQMYGGFPYFYLLILSIFSFVSFMNSFPSFVLISYYIKSSPILQPTDLPNIQHHKD